MSISRIVNNIASVNANRNLDATQRNLSRSIERLSSGLRINRAGDDAAGLSVANRLRTQVEGLNQAVTNASQGINVISTAEGALEETTSRLNRIRVLAVQSANTGVNDLNARRALQDEVFQSIDEITRIANTTQFGNNFLLNGDFSVKTELIDGQEFIGVNIDASPVGSTLENGKSFLNIIKTEQGSSQIIAGDAVGESQILNTGIINQADVAISTGLFVSGGNGGFVNGDASAAVAATQLASNFFNGVSLVSGDTIAFSGVLSDGVTQYVGSFSVGNGVGDTLQDLISTMNIAIDDAERALFGVATPGSVPADFRTSLTVATASINAGRIQLNSTGNNINEADLNISLVRGGNLVTKTDGVTRSGAIGTDSVFTGAGQVGNSVDAITGSTFGAGQFDIAVEDVQAAQQRKVESTVVFRNDIGTIADRSVSLDITSGDRSLVLNGSFVNGVYTGGTSLTNGSTITLTGTNSDGTSFQATYTYLTAGGGGPANPDLIRNDFQFNSISGLVTELNFRTRDYAGTPTLNDGDQSRFEDAVFTFTASGTLQLIDDLGENDSKTQFTLSFNGTNSTEGNFTIQDDGVLAQEGFAESATFRINGGEAVRANAGDVVTLQAAEATLEGVPQPFVTFRVGNGFSSGVDKLETTLDEYVGTLNGGNEVTFNNGDQDVVFLDGNSGGNRGVAKFTTIDFDSIIDVTQRTDGLADAGRTIIISTVNNSLNFQIGAFDGQSFKASIGDLTSENLGFGEGSGRTVSDINITSIEGADEAIRIVDEALDQVNKTRSILGAATNRLEATISNLSVSAENLTASESRIRDADIARETTEFTKNNVLLQAGVSILAQSNFTSQSFLSLIG